MPSATTPTPPSKPERAHDILRRRRPVLDAMFAPKSVALIGATETAGSVGRTILENLRTTDFGGPIYPVNPNRRTVLGIKALARIGEVPTPVDLAVIATPAATVPGIIVECVEAGVKGAVIISAGFKETGETGRELERQVLAQARRGKMRIIGPNCLGVMLPHAGLNATFAAGMARPGNVGFISQSGALCTAILDWSFRENVGFSAFVSVGSMLDVGWGDLLYWLGDDPHTRSIVIYMESIGDARAFLSAAREVTLTKPIVVIKVGRTAAAAKAAASHTGSLTGSDEVLDAAFRRVGVLRVDTIAELFDMAEVLGKQPRPRGPRLAIITNAGGPAALATDMLIRSGGEIAALSDESRRSLDALVPLHWSRGNPVDLLGDADAERYARALEIVARDPGNDGVLAILTPQAMTDAAATARRLSAFAALEGKPLLASWMGAESVAEGNAILNRTNIPTYAFPDTAARAFASMWRYSHSLDALYEIPALTPDLAVSREQAGKIIDHVRAAGRTLLTEVESKKILAAYAIPTVATHCAQSEDRAVEIARDLGGPVVLKLHSKTITHKSDIGGVKLNLHDEPSIRRAFQEIETAAHAHAAAHDFLGVTVQPMIARAGFELILGSSTDAQFGPVLLFGAGGELVEIFQDRALGLPPLNATLARRMMERTRIFTALGGVRGHPPVDLAALAGLLVRFSQLVVEQPWISEIDINPLLVTGGDFLALDARVVLHASRLAETDLPRPAIRPYPAHYVSHWELRDGTPVTIRPIRPEDEPLLVAFHRTLSAESVHLRYFGQLALDQRTTHQRLRRVCFNDYDREIALVAERGHGSSREIIGIGRLSKAHGLDEAEFALVISDQWQRHGLGTRLLALLVTIARAEKLLRLTASLLPENRAMLAVARKCGFELRQSGLEGAWKAELVF